MFINTGDMMMPSVGLATARFSAKYGLGVFGDNLFANTVVDPSKQDSKNIVVYFDSDGDVKQGGNVRTLASGPAWYVDQMIISASAEDSGTANGLIRKHINFLCSIRSEPVYCDEDQIWYRIIHVALHGRARRVGKTPAGMELYEAVLRIMWRPMSSRDSDYKTVTGITE